MNIGQKLKRIADEVNLKRIYIDDVDPLLTDYDDYIQCIVANALEGDYNCKFYVRNLVIDQYLSILDKQFKKDGIRLIDVDRSTSNTHCMITVDFSEVIQL